MIDDDQIEQIEEQYAPRERGKKIQFKRGRSHKQVIAQIADVAKNTPTGWSGIAYPTPPLGMIEQASDARAGFNPSFHASRHERKWIITYLGPFYEDSLITDVLHPVKGGKEANVYCCAAHPTIGAQWLAAKVYRPGIFRKLKNDALYREGGVLKEDGRVIRNRRAQVAMKKKTDFGKEILHANWLENEYGILRALHSAGADVPQPFASGENAMLIEYIGEEGAPAPPLNRVRLERAEAKNLFERLMHNVQVMLAHDCVHGDLSGFNVLYWEGDIWIIDFPQAVNPFKNPHAFKLLTRDLERLCDHFARYGIRAEARALARELWKKSNLPE
ncbi:MAG: hypothetical protein HY070_11720 [Chloroflexi bacterium]|nr:hypothetical protein [Chloroflexota bacterium]MBI3741744.1 hypothetical protein [Chloroflexota bacterium]